MRSRVVIVDDERLSRRGIVHRLADHDDLEVVGEFASAETALAEIPGLAPELPFLDIQMPGMSGLELARALPNSPRQHLIFVTAHDQYAVEAFAVEAIDYLLKPICDDRFVRALERFRSRASYAAAIPPKPAFLQRFVIRSGQGMQMVDATRVDRITAYGDYARLHLGERTFLIRETLQALEDCLDPKLFLRVHRSCIVQTDRIERWFPSTNRELSLLLRGGAEVKLSRSYRERFDSWLRGN